MNCLQLPQCALLLHSVPVYCVGSFSWGFFSHQTDEFQVIPSCFTSSQDLPLRCLLCALWCLFCTSLWCFTRYIVIGYFLTLSLSSVSAERKDYVLILFFQPSIEQAYHRYSSVLTERSADS